MQLRERIRRKFPGGFLRREDGAVTVEAVLWLPIFIAIFALIVDATMIMSGQAQALRVVQDANRLVSVGSIKSEEDTRTFIQTRLSGLSDNIDVQSGVAQGIITTNITMPSRDLVASGLLNVFANITVRVGAQHRAEF
jgi:Flp pilus assembly protein TadG